AEAEVEIRGRDLVSGLPKAVSLSSEEVRGAIEDPLRTIIEAVKETLERTPPELASDIADTGLTLAGGGALLRGFAERLRDETQMPAYVVESPLTCVAIGAGLSLEEPSLPPDGGRSPRRRRMQRRSRRRAFSRSG